MTGYPNPWLGTLTLKGVDEYGRERIETMPAPPPPLYFWLGRDAYPELKTIRRIIVANSVGQSLCAEPGGIVLVRS